MAEDLLAQATRIQLLKKAQAIQAQKLPPKAPDQPEDVMGDANAALQGFGQGSTAGYLPQLQALAEPAASKIGDLVTGSDTYKDLPDYTTRRDQWSKMQADLAKSNPKSYMGGQLVGAGTTAVMIPGGAMAEGAGLGAGLAAKTAAAVGTGAAYRALQNPGDTPGEVDPLQLKDRAINMSDPIAMGVDAAIPGAGKLATGIAETKAYKALGPYARDSMKAMGGDRVKDIGRSVLDSGAFGWVPKSYESLAQNLKSLKGDAGQKLGDTVEQMAQKESGSPISLSRSDIADNLEKNLISPETDAAGVASRNAKMQENISQFKRGGLDPEVAGPIDDQIPLLQAEMKKRNVANEINFDRLPGADIPDNEVFNRQLLTQLRGGVEQGGEQLAQKTGFPVDDFKNLKNQYGNLAEAQSISEKRNAKEFANRMISPSDYGTGMAGAAIGYSQGGSPEEKFKHAAMGATLGLANKGARLYGNQLMSRGMNTAGQVLNAAGQNPIVTQSLMNQPGMTPGNSIWQTLFQNKEGTK